MLEILHITPHLNGGLGRVMLSTLKHSQNSSRLIRHKIAVTETLPLESVEMFSEHSDYIEESIEIDSLIRKIEQADIVQMEWWNHPLIYKMLYLTEFPPCRLVISSHISGFHRPQIINKNIVDYSDVFLAATKATKGHPIFSTASNEEQQRKLEFVTYPVDFDRFRNFSFKEHEGFNVGYVGTLDYSKLHPQFLKMSSEVKIDDIQFIICGDDAGGMIETESQNYRPGIFIFKGFQPNIQSVFEELDVFGYPLGNAHFGSGEQAIIEAMCVGLPIVAFSNPAEKEIIRNNETGILVNTEQDYIEAIEYLHRNPAERTRIGRNAKADITKRLNPETCFANLNDIYQKLMILPKKLRVLSPLYRQSEINSNDDKCLGAKLFIESLGTQNNQFAKSLFTREQSNMRELDDAISNVEDSLKVDTKGSLYQYLYFFHNDPYLNFWAGLIKRNDGDFCNAIKYFKNTFSSSLPILGIDQYITDLNSSVKTD